MQGDDPFHVPYHEFTDVSDSNADWGATAVFPAKPSFASPFDSCNVVYIHKDDRGDAFIMYLFNKKDFNIVFPEMEQMFYVLRFK